MVRIIRVVRGLTRGYLLTPWRSPYLRWRIETYAGLDARTIDFRVFWRFVWGHRRNLMRYVRWAAQNQARLDV
jgi:hypothetical protein